MFKCVFKWILPISSVFLIIINVKILFNFEKEWCTFDKEKKRSKKKPLLQLLWTCKSTLETSSICIKFWKFISNGTLRGKKIENQIYYAPLVVFQRYKIIVLSTCFITCGSFYCGCTHVCSTYLYVYTYKWCNIVHDHCTCTLELVIEQKPCIIDCMDIAFGFSKKIGE
jgi:hypothetical protein